MKKVGAVSLRRTLMHASLFALALVSSQSHAQINFQDLLKKAQQGLQQKPATPAPARTQQPQSPPAAQDGVVTHQSGPQVELPLPDANTPRNKFVPDIVGIATEMTPKEVAAVLKKQYPEDKIEPSVRAWDRWYSDPKFLKAAHVDNYYRINNVERYRGVTLENIDVEFSYPPNEARVIAVRRSISPTDKEPQAAAVLTKALLDKFGPPSSEYRSVTGGVLYSHYLRWFWDINGKPSRNSQMVIDRDCSHIIGGNFSNFPTAAQESVNPSAVAAVRAGCFTGVAVTLQLSAGGLVNHFSIAIADFDYLVTATNKTVQYIAARDAADKKRDLDRASANKPKL